MPALSPSLEDYLEAILVLSRKEKVVRVKDVAKSLAIKPPSVIGALKALEEKGLVVHEKYGYLELSQDGILQAQKIYARHEIFYKFFHGLLRLPSAVASEDACRIEHHLSSRTMEAILGLVQLIEDSPELRALWFSRFVPEEIRNKK
ncbi:MAG: metal-dependent transcriptional regulator [bacterium]|nr:metal-dependent transcriptional regulator [bacterium]